MIDSCGVEFAGNAVPSTSMKPRQLLIACLLTCVALSATGCRTMKPVDLVADPAAPAFAMVKIGETVDVETRAGKRVRLVVGQVERDAIVSMEGVRYTRGEVVQLKRPSRWNAKTGWLIAGVVYVLAMVAGEVM